MAESKVGLWFLVSFSAFLICSVWTTTAAAQTAPVLTIEQAIAGLRSSDSTVRISSANALSGKGAARAIPSLLKASSSTDYPFRDAAARALGRIGGSDPSLHRALIQGLSDADKPARDFSVATLTNLRPSDRVTFLAVIDLVRSDTDPYPQSAIDALAAMGKPDSTVVRSLIRLLRAKDPKVRRVAIQKLHLLGAGVRPAFPELVQAIDDSDTDVRIDAIDAVTPYLVRELATIPVASAAFRNEIVGFPHAVDTKRTISPAARSIIEALVRGLIDEDDRVCYAAIMALSRIISTKQESVAEVTRIAMNRFLPGDVRRQATMSLWKRAPRVVNQNLPEATLLLSTFARLLGDDDETIRILVADMLWRFPLKIESLKDSFIVNHIALLARDRRTSVRRLAIFTLDRLRILDSRTIPALTGAVNDPDAMIRVDAVATLASISANIHPGLSGVGNESRSPDEGRSPVVPYLLRALDDKDERVRAFAIRKIGKIGTPAAPTMPVLVRMLNDLNNDLAVRIAIFKTLQAVGTNASDAVPGIVPALRDRDRTIRLGAARTLATIGPNAVAATPELIRLLHQDPDESVRQAAATALGMIGPDTPGVVTALLCALNDRDSEVRAEVIGRLCLQNVHGMDALPALTDFMGDTKRDSTERERAARTIIFNVGWTLDNAAILSDGSFKSAGCLLRRCQEQVDRTAKYRSVDCNGMAPIDPCTQTLVQAALRRAIASIDQEQSRRKWVNLPIVQKALLGFSLIALSVSLIWMFSLVRLLVAPGSLVLTHDRTESPVSQLFGIGAFRYHPRVLDAFIAANREILSRQFQSLPPVAARWDNVIDLTVSFPDGSAKVPVAADFQGLFAQPGASLQISGRPGSGRTTLACRLALDALAAEPEKRLCRAHAMIPLWLDGYLYSGNESTPGFDGTTAIALALAQLLGRRVAPDSGLVQSLLRHDRLLLITNADRLPQPMPTSARLIVATDPTPDAGLTLTTLPLPTEQIERVLPEPEDARRLQQIAADRPVTTEMAAIYARYRRAFPQQKPPQTLSDLMVSAISIPYGKISSPLYVLPQTIALAGKIAWLCLDTRFEPAGMDRSRVKIVLRQSDDGIRLPLGNSRPEPFLAFLANDLGLIDCVGTDQTWIRFTSDSVCLWLAARYLIQSGLAANAQRWSDFLLPFETKPDRSDQATYFLGVLAQTADESTTTPAVPIEVRDRIRAIIESESGRVSSGVPI